MAPAVSLALGVVSPAQRHIRLPLIADICICINPMTYGKMAPALWSAFLVWLSRNESMEMMPTGYSSRLHRRRFVSMLAWLGGFAAAMRGLGHAFEFSPVVGSATGPAETAAGQLVRYPQKTDLILLTDRPPQLETPLHYFQADLTPNDAFFVRWHLSGIPTTVDLRTFRLEVSGHVSKPLSLSVADLQSKFEPVSAVALCQCAGNRSEE